MTASPNNVFSLLLQLPLEIRLHIYRQLLVAPVAVIEPERNLVSIPDYPIYKAEPTTSDDDDDDDDDDVVVDGNDAGPSANDDVSTRAMPNYTLSFRNYAPFKTASSAAVAQQKQKRRSSYKIRSDRFRNRCIDATYICLNPPPGINTAFMQTCKQVHDEAARVLYGGVYTFDFDTNIEACVPFLMDLTPTSRACVRRIGLVKRSLPYDKDFDRCEWESMCDCLANKTDFPALDAISLGVMAGKPIMGWDEGNIPRFTKEQFAKQIIQRDDMQWARDLQRVQALKHLDIRACVEHCPPPTSNAMAFFVSFSASIEFGFRDYLSETMRTATPVSESGSLPETVGQVSLACNADDDDTGRAK